jgi:hypothetical protein
LGAANAMMTEIVGGWLRHFSEITFLRLFGRWFLSVAMAKPNKARQFPHPSVSLTTSKRPSERNVGFTEVSEKFSDGIRHTKRQYPSCSECDGISNIALGETFETTKEFMNMYRILERIH